MIRTKFLFLIVAFVVILVQDIAAQQYIRPKYMPFGEGHRNELDEYDRKQGVWKFYSRNKVLIRETTFQNDIRHGPELKYHSLTGVTFEELNYFNGRKDGEYKKYYHSGGLKTEGAFKEGYEDGKWIYYYRVNGEVKREVTYKDGIKDGLYRFYSAKGYLVVEGFYKDDLKEGDWKYYNRKGKVTKTIQYHKNVKVDPEAEEEKKKKKNKNAKKKGDVNPTAG